MIFPHITHVVCQLGSTKLTAQTDVSVSATACKLPVSGSAPWTVMVENVENMAGLFPVNHVLFLYCATN